MKRKTEHNLNIFTHTQFAGLQNLDKKLSCLQQISATQCSRNKQFQSKYFEAQSMVKFLENLQQRFDRKCRLKRILTIEIVH
jgi:hypothetical protein